MRFDVNYRGCPIPLFKTESTFYCWDFTKADEPEVHFTTLIECLLWIKGKVDEYLDSQGIDVFI